VSVSAATFPTQKTSATRSPRPVAIWLLVCCAMIFAMVVIGGITRLTESGLSITEWKPVTGALPPLSDQAWQEEFQRYQQIPEFRERHSDMTLAEYKNIFWWEFVHRLWGRLIGTFYLLPFLFFVAKGYVRGGLAWRLGGIFVLGGLQGALGCPHLASGLVDRVDVSPYRLTAHLGLAVLIYCATFWTALDLLRPPDARRVVDTRAVWLACLVFVTMLAGGLVAGHDAGLIYNTFPLMDGRYFPAGYFDVAPWWANPFANPIAVQFDHRLLGEATVILALVYWWRARRDAIGASVSFVAAMAVVQVALGISTLLLVVPIPLAAVHQAGAVTLLTLAILAAHAGRRPARA